MELFYKSFFLVRAFMNADAQVPPPAALPDTEDRFLTQELESRRAFPLLEVLEVLRNMSQRDLLETHAQVEELEPTVTLSEEAGLEPANKSDISDAVSLAPEPRSVSS